MTRQLHFAPEQQTLLDNNVQDGAIPAGGSPTLYCTYQTAYLVFIAV